MEFWVSLLHQSAYDTIYKGTCQNSELDNMLCSPPGLPCRSGHDIISGVDAALFTKQWIDDGRLSVYCKHGGTSIHLDHVLLIQVLFICCKVWYAYLVSLVLLFFISHVS